MSMSYDADALWLKAKLFINRAMEDEDGRSFDERALWASLALELLAKSALSRRSPLLIAEPNEEGKNILAAAGLITADPGIPFTTVRASTVFKRCARAFNPFNADEAIKIANARNEYLHGGGIGFGGIRPEKWWPQFWTQVESLVNAQDASIEDLVGADRFGVVEEHLNRNKQIISMRVDSLINRARQRYALYRNGQLPAKEQAAWESHILGSSGLTYGSNCQCPACESQGDIEGDEVVDIRIETEEVRDDIDAEYNVWGIGEIAAERFFCPTCRLMLEGYELLDAAGMDETFEVIDDEFLEAGESDYGND